MDALQRITERVYRNGDPNEVATPRPLLTIEEFFEGNTDAGSIGCNIYPEPPAPEQFYAFFQRIAARADVKDIRVRVTDVNEGEWPFADTVYVMTSASPNEVMSWFDDAMKPDETWEGFRADEAYEPYVVPQGVRAVACWWD